jgi:hypothetical protein
VGLDLPGRQRRLQPRRWRGWPNFAKNAGSDQVGRHISSGKLLKDFKARRQGLGRLDLAHGRPQSDGPAPLCVKTQAIPKLSPIVPEPNSCTVSAHIQRVHDPGPGSHNICPCFGACGLHITAVTLNELPRTGRVISNLKQVLILRAGPRPLASGAATKTLPKHAQPHHRIRSGGRGPRCGRENRPQLSR